jgi:NADH-quinone oxidoreductase subunit J
MDLIFFWLFSILTLGFAVMVVAQRNPVASALSLVVSFIGLAELFLLLGAFFIFIIQILVYAGAVMVLFLFIIMLLDLRAEERRKWNPLAVAGGAVVSLGFALVLVRVIHRFPEGNQPFPQILNQTDDVHMIGMTLFSGYNLPLQVIGVLVLVATIGVVVLSKRELK